MGTGYIAAATLWMAISGVGAAEPQATRIVIFDQAGVAEPTLRKATEIAREIFQVAGVETEWTVCRLSTDSAGQCNAPASGEYIKVLLRPDGSGLQRTNEGVGLAVIVKGEPRVLCYVFVGPAKALANAVHGNVDVVLAAIMAHEVGHLMGLAHSTSGIMRPKFERAEIIEAESGRLLFDSHQVKTLRGSAKKMSH